MFSTQCNKLKSLYKEKYKYFILGGLLISMHIYVLFGFSKILTIILYQSYTKNILFIVTFLLTFIVYGSLIGFILYKMLKKVLLLRIIWISYCALIWYVLLSHHFIEKKMGIAGFISKIGLACITFPYAFIFGSAMDPSPRSIIHQALGYALPLITVTNFYVALTPLVLIFKWLNKFPKH